MTTYQLSAFQKTAAAAQPLERYFRLFVSDKKAEGKSDRYIEWLGEKLVAFNRWHEESYSTPPALSDLNPGKVRLFIVDEQGRPRWPNHPWRKEDKGTLSSSTVRGTVRGLKVFSAWLAAEGLTPGDVLASIKVPKAQERELEPLSLEEEKRLVKACDDRTSAGARRLAIVLLFLDTGIRLSELVGLNYDQVRLDEGYITVLGKGRRQRSVSFGRKTERALRNYALLYREPATVQAEQFFFLDRDGYPLTGNAVKTMFRRLRKRTGIDRLHPHLLRHTHGVRSVEAGQSTLVIQARMGHSTPQVTERYVHAASSDKIRRDRSFSHIDQLDVKVSRSPRRHRTGAGSQAIP